MLTSDRDYLFFALQIDYPDKLNPSMDVTAFCERWDLSVGDFYKALGDLKNKGLVMDITNPLFFKSPKQQSGQFQIANGRMQV
ncbi:hypothetical protein [Phormidesmis priestleyi]|uniref:hypothetical protein n=1 Tax=Phormidesmis priestleyi TaxID=268141 RepID=UPI00083A8DDE|nr:hypothetical protein [Phormidesmis priestleyi]